MATIKYKPLPELDETLRAKFWSRVASGAEDDCWPWTGGMFAKDYGCFPVNRRSYYAHRYALALSSGVDLVGLVVCHRCDNPRCCNPAHLFAGTHQDNTQDMLSKGRGPTAEQRWESRADWRAERKSIRLEKKRVRDAEVAERARKAQLVLSNNFTPQTINYLLSLAISERDRHAQSVVDGEQDGCNEQWAKATIAVRELLELSTLSLSTSASAAISLQSMRKKRSGGHNGGRAARADK